MLQMSAVRVTALCFLVGSLFLGCTDSASKEEGGASELLSSLETIDPTAGYQPKKEDPMKPIATINGEPVTRDDLNQKMANLVQQMTGGQAPPSFSPQQQAQLQQQAFQQIILERQLHGFATQNELQVEANVIEAEISTIMESFGGVEKFEKAMKDAGMDRETLKGDIRKSKLAEMAVNHYKGGLADASETDVETFYKENIDRYSVKEMVSASHILWGFTEGEDDASKTSKRKEADEVRTKLLESGDFAELAKTHSSCPSANDGGALGTFPREDMIPAFSDVAFALEIDEISEVVETEFGYHVIKVTEHTDAKTSALTEIKDKVASDVKEDLLQKWFQTLVSEAKVEDLSQQ